jgi:pyruvate dehydrogenase E2 component (dihydrolipoamide acetyltransferase)
MTIFRVPDLGEGLTEVQIVTWHVDVGDHVVADQPLVSVETDKAVVEIPAPQAGRVTRRFGEPGDVVAVGVPLVELAGLDTGGGTAIVGALPGPAPTPAPTTAAVRAAPAVRRRAAELGIALSEVSGTGPDGAVTLDDLERATTRPARPTAGPAEPLRGVRRTMAANMERAGRQIVPATVTDDADVGGWSESEDVTIRLVQAVVAGCSAEPALNAWYLGPDQGRVLHTEVDVGIATDTPDGLFVPVLRGAQHREPAELRADLDVLASAVHARTASPESLRDPTITLSNFGAMAGRYASLVIVPPQVAILGAGRIEHRVVARDDSPVVRAVLPLSLTFDHRVVTGGEATRFLGAVIAELRHPT